MRAQVKYIYVYLYNILIMFFWYTAGWLAYLSCKSTKPQPICRQSVGILSNAKRAKYSVALTSAFWRRTLNRRKEMVHSNFICITENLNEVFVHVYGVHNRDIYSAFWFLGHLKRKNVLVLYWTKNKTNWPSR